MNYLFTPASIGSLTLESWVYMHTDATDQVVVGKYDKFTGDRSYDLGLNRAGFPPPRRSYFTISEDGSFPASGVVQSADQVTLNNWYYIVGVYRVDTREMRVYTNGSLQGQMISSEASVHISNQEVLIGVLDNGFVFDGFFDGSLDEVRISATNRSADWIAAQYLSMNDNFINFEYLQELNF